MSKHTGGISTTYHRSEASAAYSDDGFLGHLLSCGVCDQHAYDEGDVDDVATFPTDDNEDDDYTKDERDDVVPLETLDTIDECEEEYSNDDNEIENDETTSENDETYNESTFIGDSSSSDSTISSTGLFSDKHNASRQRFGKGMSIYNDELSFASTVKNIELFLMIEPQTIDASQHTTDSFFVATFNSNASNGVNVPVVDNIYAFLDTPSMISTVPSELLGNRKGLFDLDSGETFVPSFDYIESLRRNKSMVRRARLKLPDDKGPIVAGEKAIPISEKDTTIDDKIYKDWLKVTPLLGKMRSELTTTGSEQTTGTTGKTTFGSFFSFGRRKQLSTRLQEPMKLPRLIVEHRQDKNQTRASNTLIKTLIHQPNNKAVPMRDRALTTREGPPTGNIDQPSNPTNTIRMNQPIACEAILQGSFHRSLVTAPSSKMNNINQKRNQMPVSSTKTDKYSSSTMTKKVRNTSSNKTNYTSSPDERDFLSIRSPALLHGNERRFSPSSNNPLHVTKLFFHEALQPDDGLFSQFDFLPLESLNSR
jgi:hypothetical protein